MEPRDLPVTAALAALSVTVALAFARVLGGDRWVLPLVAAAIGAHAVAAAVRALRRPLWAEISVSAATLVVAILVATPGGPSPGAVIDRIRTGWAVVRVHAVPLPPRPGVVVLAAIVVWAVAALADVLAFRRDASLGALAPGVVIVIWCTALGTHEDRWLTVGSFGVAAVVFLALQHQRLLERYRAHLGPGRTLVDAPRMLFVGALAGALAVGLGIVAAVALPDADRPMIDTGGLGDQGGGARSYRTQVPPLLDVGDELRQEPVQQLFTVRAKAPDYWRITALDEYRSDAGGQWALTAEGDDAVGTGLDEHVPAGALVQQYSIGPLSERWMPAAYRAVRVSAPGTLVVRASSTLVTSRDAVARMRYRVTSALPTRTVDAAARRAAATGKVPAGLRRYTRLPADLPPVVADTAASVTSGIEDPIGRATALRDYFRSGAFAYDPSVTLGDDESAVATFLAERRGFCVQFATAYALMARSLGIPARVAVGFTSGTLDPATGTYSVTNHDAHAWPELWFPGLGWTHLFDPTPASELPGGSNLIDEVPPLAPPAPTQTATPPTTVATAPTASPPTTAVSGASPATTVPRGSGVQISTEEHAGTTAPIWPFVVVGVVLLAVIAPIVAVVVWKRRRRARRRDDPDPRRAIVGAWREVLDTLADHRIRASAAETPLELAARVPSDVGRGAAPPLHSLAEAYTAARYSGEPPRVERARAAWHDVDELRRALDERHGVWQRTRARLSPRTLPRREREGEPV
jgi:transglutaminase-like putative cysteine protease